MPAKRSKKIQPIVTPTSPPLGKSAAGFATSSIVAIALVLAFGASVTVFAQSGISEKAGCTDLGSCIRTIGQNLWATITSTPPPTSVSHAEVAGATPVPPTTGSANPLILQPAANDYVGIGDITPSQKLDVAGKVKADEFCIGTDCQSEWMWKKGSLTETDTPFGNFQYTMKALSVGSSGQPTQWLDVAGQVKANGFCIGTDCKTSWASIGQWQTGTRVEGNTPISYSLGNVGIGTPNPSGVFEVAGQKKVLEVVGASVTTPSDVCPTDISGKSIGYQCKSGTRNVTVGRYVYFNVRQDDKLLSLNNPRCVWAPNLSIKEIVPTTEATEAVGALCDEDYVYTTKDGFEQEEWEVTNSIITTYRVSAEQATVPGVMEVKYSPALVVGSNGNVGIGVVPQAESSLAVSGWTNLERLLVGSKNLVVSGNGNVGIGRDPRNFSKFSSIAGWHGLPATLDVNGQVAMDRLTLTDTGGTGDTNLSKPSWHIDNAGGRLRIFTQPTANEGGSEVLSISHQANGTAALDIGGVGNKFWRIADDQNGVNPGKLRIQPITNDSTGLTHGNVDGAATTNITAGITIIRANGETFGNVGINNIDPRHKLDVNGDINVAYLGSNLAQSSERQRLALATDRIGLDVAEIYQTNEDVEVGDVLVAGNKDRTLEKSTKPYAVDLIGIVSGAPALLFEGNELKLGSKPDRFIKGSKPPVALAGRVPVKVSLENGDIHVGDYLTSASKKGVAMRATEPGMALGIALENYSGGGDGKVLAFVNIGEKNVAQRVQALEKELKILKKKK